jgi:hypothetical protein
MDAAFQHYVAMVRVAALGTGPTGCHLEAVENRETSRPAGESLK